MNVDTDADKLTVVGNLDPAKLRDRLAEKTKKKVNLVSPQPKKENKDKKKSEDKNSKEVKMKTKHHHYTHSLVPTFLFVFNRISFPSSILVALFVRFLI